MKQCSKCGKQIRSDSKTGFCQTCLIQHRREEKIRAWLKTGNTGFTVDTTIRGVIREYIFNDQNGKCAICGWIIYGMVQN